MKTIHEIVMDSTDGVPVERLSHTDKNYVIYEMAQIIQQLEKEIENIES